MKKISLSIFLVLVILIIIGGFLFVNSDFEYNKKEVLEKKEVSEEIDLSEFNLEEEFEIIEIKSAYISEEDYKDQLLLVGKKPHKENSAYWEEIMVILKNENNNTIIKKKLDEFNGYEPELVLNDFTGNNKEDIFIKAASGGSGGIYFHRVITLKEKNLQIIFGENNNDGINVVGYFDDNFKANLMFKNLNKRVILDISVNKEEYIEQDIYNEDGKMINIDLVRPYSYPFSDLEVIDYNQDGKYELRGIQRIVGAYGADTISEVESIWSYEEGKWDIMSVNYTTYLKK